MSRKVWSPSQFNGLQCAVRSRKPQKILDRNMPSPLAARKMKHLSDMHRQRLSSLHWRSIQYRHYINLQCHHISLQCHHLTQICHHITLQCHHFNQHCHHFQHRHRTHRLYPRQNMDQPPYQSYQHLKQHRQKVHPNYHSIPRLPNPLSRRQKNIQTQGGCLLTITHMSHLNQLEVQSVLPGKP